MIAAFLGGGGGWRAGYMTIGIAQAALAAGLFFSKPLWKPETAKAADDTHKDGVFVSNREAFKIRGVKASLVTFFCYCALEIGTGLWAASYLTTQRGVTPTEAALWVSLYYGGITAGRFVNGLLSEKIKSELLIRGGMVVIAFGAAVLLLPLPPAYCMAGLILIGLGCAPIYPSMIYLVPKRFGKVVSQSVIGLSMACAYVGSTFMPPLIGAASTVLSLGVLPFAIVLFWIGMAVASEVINRQVAGRQIEGN